MIQEIGPGGTREIPFLEAAPDWFEHVPRELRLFGDWEQSSADAHRVFAHWALDIRDYTHKGEPEVGFIPRPLRPPKDRLLPMPDVSLHILMDRPKRAISDVAVRRHPARPHQDKCGR